MLLIYRYKKNRNLTELVRTSTIGIDNMSSNSGTKIFNHIKTFHFSAANHDLISSAVSFANLFEMSL